MKNKPCETEHICPAVNKCKVLGEHTRKNKSNCVCRDLKKALKKVEVKL